MKYWPLSMLTGYLIPVSTALVSEKIPSLSCSGRGIPFIVISPESCDSTVSPSNAAILPVLIPSAVSYTTASCPSGLLSLKNTARSPALICGNMSLSLTVTAPKRNIFAAMRAAAKTAVLSSACVRWNFIYAPVS